MRGRKGGKPALHGVWEGMEVNGRLESSDCFVQLFNAPSGASTSSTGSGNNTSLPSLNVFVGLLAHILYHLLATCSRPEIKP